MNSQENQAEELFKGNIPTVVSSLKGLKSRSGEGAVMFYLTTERDKPVIISHIEIGNPHLKKVLNTERLIESEEFAHLVLSRAELESLTNGKASYEAGLNAAFDSFASELLEKIQEAKKAFFDFTKSSADLATQFVQECVSGSFINQKDPEKIAKIEALAYYLSQKSANAMGQNTDFSHYLKDFFSSLNADVDKRVSSLTNTLEKLSTPPPILTPGKLVANMESTICQCEKGIVQHPSLPNVFGLLSVEGLVKIIEVKEEEQFSVKTLSSFKAKIERESFSNSISFSPDGRHVAVSSYFDRRICIYTVDLGDLVQVFDYPVITSCIAKIQWIAPNLLFSSLYKGEISLVDPWKPREIDSFLTFGSTATQFCFNSSITSSNPLQESEHYQVILGDMEGRLFELVFLPFRILKRKNMVHDGRICSIKVCGNEYVATGGVDKIFKLLNGKSWEIIQSYQMDTPVSDIFASPNGSFIIFFSRTNFGYVNVHQRDMKTQLTQFNFSNEDMFGVFVDWRIKKGLVGTKSGMVWEIKL